MIELHIGIGFNIGQTSSGVSGVGAEGGGGGGSEIKYYFAA